MLTPNEQLFLELVNAARLDPEGEAARQGHALNDDLDPGTIPGTPVQPLAANGNVQQAAESHSQWMLDTDTFSHTGEGGSSPSDRMRDADYAFEGNWSSGENIAWSGTTGSLDLLATITQHHDGLYASEGHRENLFAAQFRETGIAQEQGTFEARGSQGDVQDFNASMLTHKFALSGSDVFLTGVIYGDTDGNASYSVGEGQGNVTVAADGAVTSSWGAGGYSLGVTSGPAVSVTLGSGAGAIDVTMDLSGDNVKLDLVDGDRILTSGDIILGDGASEVQLLGAVDNDATGNADDNIFHVGHGDNTVIGGAGTDRVVFTGARADYTVVENGDGTVTVTDDRSGADTDGTNMVGEVAYLDFSDKSVSLLPQGDATALSGHLAAPNGTPLPQTALRFSLSDGSEESLTTDVAGGFNLSLPQGLTGHLSMAPGAETTGALDVGDALDVLRLAVGLEPSFGPETPHDLIAADVDFSGDIGVDDALNVLRAAVGLNADGAEPGAHVLLDPEQSLDGVRADNVSYARGMDIGHGDAGSVLAPDVVTLGDLGALNAV